MVHVATDPFGIQGVLGFLSTVQQQVVAPIAQQSRAQRVLSPVQTSAGAASMDARIFSQAFSARAKEYYKALGNYGLSGARASAIADVLVARDAGIL